MKMAQLIKLAVEIFAVELMAPYSFVACVCVRVCAHVCARACPSKGVCPCVSGLDLPIKSSHIPATSVTCPENKACLLFSALPAMLFKVINLNLPKRQKSLLDHCLLTRTRAQ